MGSSSSKLTPSKRASMSCVDGAGAKARPLPFSAADGARDCWGGGARVELKVCKEDDLAGGIAGRCWKWGETAGGGESCRWRDELAAAGPIGESGCRELLEEEAEAGLGGRLRTGAGAGTGGRGTGFRGARPGTGGEKEWAAERPAISA